MICYETTLLIPSTILSYIEADLGPDPSYAWIANSWSLCAAVVVSIAGRLGDIFGRRYFSQYTDEENPSLTETSANPSLLLVLCGTALALIGAIIGATGKSIPQMIASGIFFGIAAGIQETYYACLMELVPYKRRTFFIGKFTTLVMILSIYLRIVDRPWMRLRPASFGISIDRLWHY